MVHCLWAQQTAKLHGFGSDHGQRIHVPRLQWKPLRPERRAALKQEHSCHCQDRWEHMLICTVQYICVCVCWNVFFPHITGDIEYTSHFCSDLWVLTTFSCPPTLLHRPGVKTKPLQGEGRVLFAQVYSASGWQICGGRIQHCHQLCCPRLPQGKHAC